MSDLQTKIITEEEIYLLLEKCGVSRKGVTIIGLPEQGEKDPSPTILIQTKCISGMNNLTSIVGKDVRNLCKDTWAVEWPALLEFEI